MKTNHPILKKHLLLKKCIIEEDIKTFNKKIQLKGYQEALKYPDTSRNYYGLKTKDFEDISKCEMSCDRILMIKKMEELGQCISRFGRENNSLWLLIFLHKIGNTSAPQFAQDIRKIEINDVLTSLIYAKSNGIKLDLDTEYYETIRKTESSKAFYLMRETSCSDRFKLFLDIYIDIFIEKNITPDTLKKIEERESSNILWTLVPEDKQIFLNGIYPELKIKLHKETPETIQCVEAIASLAGVLEDDIKKRNIEKKYLPFFRRYCDLLNMKESKEYNNQEEILEEKLKFGCYKYNIVL